MNFKRKRRQARAYYWNPKQLYRTADRMKARRFYRLYNVPLLDTGPGE